MQKYIDVDVLGFCGNSTSCVGQRVPCLESVFRPYRFYLAFENSQCSGYITEKFFKVFAPDIHIVPVVLGRVDLEKYFPPKTFVDVGNFATPRDLSLNLLKLGSNLTAYGEFLEAMDEYHGVDCYDHFCTMCNAVTSLRLRPKVYDIYSWLSKQCQP
ncbi:hypothetical protein Btru_020130 [Bulinus truncatus]|nr:hypothetical protein Btru_020130 [Bulinus truncatus]